MASSLLKRQEATLKAIANSQQSKLTYAQITAQATQINLANEEKTRSQASLASMRKEATINAIQRANQEATTRRILVQGEQISSQELEERQNGAATLKERKDNQPPKEKEWTTVMRKHYIRKTQNRKFTNPHLEKKLQLLREQGKCYRCLERGHTQAQCRNSVKCYTCNKLGHTSGRCKEKRQNLDRNINRPQSNTTVPTLQNRGENKHTQTKEQDKTENKEESMDNWQTMPMLPASRLPGARPEQQIVYVPNREGFHPSNEALDRAAAVHVGPNVNKQTLPQRLATTLAAQLGHHPRDFEVGQLDPAFAHCIVIFPTQDLRNYAVHVGVFAVDYNSYVQLAEWKRTQGMVYAPLEHKARICIYGVPPHNANIDDIDQLLSGLGHVTKLAPVFKNGNYHSVRVMVVCQDAVLIPKTLLMRSHPYAKLVTLKLEGWLHTPTGPTLPPGGGDSRINNPRQGGAREPPHNRHRRSSDSSEYNNSVSNEYQMGADSTYSRRERQIQQWCLENPQLESPILLGTGEMELGQTSTQENRFVLVNAQPQVGKDNEKGEFSAHGDKKAMSTMMSSVESVGENRGSTIEKESRVQRRTLHVAVEHTLGSVILHAQYNQTEPVKIVLQTINFVNPTRHLAVMQVDSSEEKFSGIIFKRALENQGRTNSTTGAFVLMQGPTETFLPIGPEDFNGEIILQSPKENKAGSEEPNSPPGFEGPPQFKGERQIRRSPRLLKKNDGVYVSAIDKARAVLGYEDNATPLRNKRKVSDGSEVQLDYLRSYDPLTSIQAELICAAAGAEASKEMKAQFESLGCNGGEGIDQAASN